MPVASVAHAGLLSQLEIYLVAVPSVAWFAVLVELSRPCDHWRARTKELLLVGGVAALTLFGAMVAGSVDGPLRPGHLLMFAVISISTLGAMVAALRRPAQPMPVAGVVVVATLFFALANAILIIPLGLLPSWLALASTGFDVLLLGVAVAVYFPYVVGVRAYAQNATASGLDPTARQAWQWLVTEVPQRSLHNRQSGAARLIAADLRGRVPVPSD